MTNSLDLALFSIETERNPAWTLSSWVTAHQDAILAADVGSTDTLVSVYSSGGHPVSVITKREAGWSDEVFVARHGQAILSRMQHNPPD